MLRTNNKAVKNYFDNLLSDIIEDNFDNNIELMQDQLVSSTTDANNRLAKSDYPTFQEAFTTISENYGSCYYDEMRDTLKEALQETDQEAAKYNNDQVANLYNYLLYSAYLRAIEKAGFTISKGYNLSRY